MTRALPYLAALVVAGGLAGCGGSQHSTTASGSSSPTTVSTAGTSTQTPTTTTSTTMGSATPPAGGPVPRGFDPVSFTAISDQQFWLLGTAPCSNPVCTSVVRTTDGGRHFVGIPAPVAPLASAGAAQGHGLSQLRFANQLDGFAGGAAYPQRLWETHDGGQHWSEGLGSVVAFTVSAGRVYAVTGRWAGGTYTHLRLAVSPAYRDDWHTTALAGPMQFGLGITAHGSSVWIWGTPTASSVQAQTLLYSSDAGQTLMRLRGPCVPGLGGDLQASSDEVVWAVCPTGMMAQAWRSADAGLHWQNLPVGLGERALPLSNGARLAPASDQVAVISASALGPVERTTNGGGSFAIVGPAQPREPGWDWIGFTDTVTGSALRPASSSATGPGGLELLQLWRSYDGGAHWSGPVRIG